MYKPLFLVVFTHSSLLFSMEQAITDIPFHPVAQARAFFDEIDKRIIEEVKNAQIACEQRAAPALINHVKHIDALLQKCLDHETEFKEAYAKQEKSNETKREQLSLDQASIEQVYAFRKATQSLLNALESFDEGPIESAEWYAMSLIFKARMPDQGGKKARFDTSQ